MNKIRSSGGCSVLPVFVPRAGPEIQDRQTVRTYRSSVSKLRK